MSKKEKFASISAGLEEALDKIEPQHKEIGRPKTAPGQLLAFRNEMIAYEEKIAALEARIKDLESTAIPISAITTNPWQPRRVFDEAEIQKLATSIAEVGLIQPIIVRSVPNMDTPLVTGANPSDDLARVPNMDTSCRYQLVAGERRWRAYQKLGKDMIKAIIIEAGDDEMAALALAENFDREDLTAYEIALAIQKAEATFPNRKSMAAALGINRTDLYRFMAFFQLPSFVIEDLESEPWLLGRHAAEDIAAVIKKHGDCAIEILRHLWVKLKSGEIDQGKIASMIDASVARGAQVSVQRDIRKLFVGKVQAGSITRDASKLKIEIRSAVLTPEKELELRKFVEEMFSESNIS